MKAEHMTIDQLVEQIDGPFFPCTFLHRHRTDDQNVTAFDVERARRYLELNGYLPGGHRMVAALPERCLFEELVRCVERQCWDFLDEDGVVQVTDR